MITQFSDIMREVNLFSSSITSCVVRMVGSFLIFPYFLCAILVFFFGSSIPPAVEILQFVLYAGVIAAYWYSCNVRMWADSYMIRYSNAVQRQEGACRCPRCGSRMVPNSVQYTYEEKIGEVTHKTYYSDGDVYYYTEDINITRSEDLPIWVCKGNNCGLRTKALRSSAMSSEVRRQIREEYAFYEMPRSLNSVHRLIMGDLDEVPNSPMINKFHGHTLHVFFAIIAAFVLFLSAIGDGAFADQVQKMLFGGPASLLGYLLMSIILIVGYFLIRSHVLKQSEIIRMDSEYLSVHHLLYDYKESVSLIKAHSDKQLKERQKLVKQAKKKNDPYIETMQEYKYRGDYQRKVDQSNYATDALNVAIELFQELDTEYSYYYINGCYILVAENLTKNEEGFQYLFNTENGFVRLVYKARFGLNRDHSKAIVDEWFEEAAQNMGHIFPEVWFDDRSYGMDIAVGILPECSLIFGEKEKERLRSQIVNFRCWIASLQERPLY